MQRIFKICTEEWTLSLQVWHNLIHIQIDNLQDINCEITFFPLSNTTSNEMFPLLCNGGLTHTAKVLLSLLPVTTFVPKKHRIDSSSHIPLVWMYTPVPPNMLPAWGCTITEATKQWISNLTKSLDKSDDNIMVYENMIINKINKVLILFEIVEYF